VTPDRRPTAGPTAPVRLHHPEARLVDAATGDALGGTQLAAAIAAAADRAASTPAGLQLRLLPTSIDAIVDYVGALAAGRPVALLAADTPAPYLAELAHRYQPAAIAGGEGAPPAGYRAAPDGRQGWWRSGDDAAPAHPELALLLGTSGSTGSPKLVRLSAGAVMANAEAIVKALSITGADVTVTSLPLHYTFGLSVLHSYLLAGATVVLNPGTFVQRAFWSTVDEHRVTSLSAVPSQYEMLRRLRFTVAAHASLRTLTAAGGRLRPDLVLERHRDLVAHSGQLFVMYGATEATARMTVLAPERLPEKAASVGAPLPGGRVALDAEGQVTYQGPNVMMGYATEAEDLARGDDLGGVLATGDLGRLDEDGDLYLTGRIKRIAKIFGIRVNLDDVETMLAGHAPVAALADDDGAVILIEQATASECERIRRELADQLGLHSSGLRVLGVEAIPLLSNGKIDYRLAQEVAS
jgi:acyl-CoA synthetase (AMP-forming)/AMP-acid ligase II